MKPLGILCFSSSDWFGNWGSRQQVMRRFARRGHRVFFVEQMAGLEHFWRYPDLRHRRRQRRREGVTEIETNLWLYAPPPLFPGRYYSQFIAGLNARIVERDLREHLYRLGDKPLLWLYLPEHASLLGRFGERLSVYHCIDEWSVGAGGRKLRTVVSLERRLLEDADVVFANSAETLENKRRWNHNTHRIPSGVDVEHFAAAAWPGEIDEAVARLAPPVLMFVGNINEKIDVRLLADVARRKPDASVVLVGRYNPRAVDADELFALPNVHTLGERPFEEVPSLLRAAHVCLLPYAGGEATRYRSPLKLYEYLATGKPVVSTPHPEVEVFADLITIAGPDRFAEAIDASLSTDSETRRRARMEAAAANSWDARVDAMEAVLGEHM